MYCDGRTKSVQKYRSHLETVVHVLDAALGAAEVNEVDLVKDHSLQDTGRIVKKTLNIKHPA
jgi:hypothetical protein